MIISDSKQPRNSFCLDNSISDKGTIKIDIVTLPDDKVIILNLTQIKLLHDHLNYMLKEYEGKTNRNLNL